MLRAVPLVAITLLAAACEPAPPADARGCWGAGCAVVATSHYNPDFTGVGALHTVKMPERAVVKDLDSSLDPDLFLARADREHAWVINRNTGSVRLYNLATFAVVMEISTGSAEAPAPLSMPSQLWASPTTNALYVTFAGNQGTHAVGVLDKTRPDAGVVRYIEIPPLPEDPDGSPEAGPLYACNGKLYVGTSDYSINGRDVTYHGGRIAVIDLGSDKLESVITLTTRSVAAIAQEGDDCTRAVAVTSGHLSAVPDGTSGFERVDLAKGQPLGMMMTDLALEGRPTSLAIVSPTLAFSAVYFDPQLGMDGKPYLASTKVVALNPSTGQRIADVAGPAGFINFAKVSPDNRLWIAAGSFAGMPEPGKLAPGLYVGPADGTPLTSEPIDLGQTPSAILFH